MNFQEYQLLRAEKVALEEMLSHTPQENVIERVGLEYRKAEIEAQLASQPSPVREPAKANLLLSEERAQLTENSLVDALKKWCQHDIPQEDGQNYDGLQWRAQAQDEVIAIITAYEQSKEKI